MGSGAQTSQNLFAVGAGQNPCPPLPELDAAVVCLQLFLSTRRVWFFLRWESVTSITGLKQKRGDAFCLQMKKEWWTCVCLLK